MLNSTRVAFTTSHGYQGREGSHGLHPRARSISEVYDNEHRPASTADVPEHGVVFPCPIGTVEGRRGSSECFDGGPSMLLKRVTRKPHD